ncbi:60S ribosomal protein L30 [Microtus ochrogaster]|uniref:Large ribosomal subunit protein eL30 n=1 Tax=Microtus ochrogaster TaxID=79684 RepID=A0A8J6KSK7_MICOH|nr:60S ribosomal protein L30 [Microtus ochrogaster]
MVATTKTKKSLESINSRLQLDMKSGKYVLGYKQTLKMIRQGKAKLVILNNNCPALRKSEIEHYAMLAKTGVHHYSGNNIGLGTACGKYYRVCTLAIIDPGILLNVDLHQAMKGDGDPRWSTGLKSQGPNQEQKERELEQGTQDSKGCTHTRRQWGCSIGNSPRPAGLGLKRPGMWPDSLNIADNGDY